MSQFFLIQNQDKQFLSKQGEWVGIDEGNSLYRTPHKDEAINIKVEHSVKNADIRLTIVPCTLNQRGLPVLCNADSDLADVAGEAIDQNQGPLFTEDNGDLFSQAQSANEDPILDLDSGTESRAPDSNEPSLNTAEI